MDLEKGLTKMLITLTPKVARLTYVKDFKPISLLNISFKIITKIVTNRLKDIMPNFISNT